eukprot:433766_1
MTSLTVIVFATTFIEICLAQGNKVPAIQLHNAADPTLRMPVVGLGTGGYASAKSSQATPEHWNASEGFINTLKWFSLGGIRYDSSLSYPSAPGVAAGLINVTNNYTTTPRKDIFITSKICGSGEPLGYNEAIEQHSKILKMFNTSYVDLLLIHWPTCTSENCNKTTSTKSTTKYCNASNHAYNSSACRQSTWKAMEYIFNNGGARAVGVSNFEAKHLQDIIDMNSLNPAVNQFEFHGYWHEFGLVRYCQSMNITVNSYGPLGTPDVECDGYAGWPYVLPENPVAIDIGKKYKKTASQIWLRWAFQQSIVLNPRTLNIQHMKDNINIFDFELNNEDMNQLSTANSTAPKYPNNKVAPDPNTFP